MNLNLHSLAYPVTALGPGRRVALWVAGCPLRCRGCVTPALLDAAAGKPVPIARLAQRILELPAAIDGITLTGGEPFAQASALAALIDQIRTERPNWDVLCFSGFTLEHLQRSDNGCRDLLSRLDILVDGPYLETRPGHHPLTASANQRVHLLSARAQLRRDEVDALRHNHANLAVNPRGADWLIGILDADARATLHRNARLVPAPLPTSAAPAQHTPPKTVSRVSKL